MKSYVLLCVVLLFPVTSAEAVVYDNNTITVASPLLEDISWKEIGTIYVNISCDYLNQSYMYVYSNDTTVITLRSPFAYLICDDASVTQHFNISIYGEFLGRTSVTFYQDQTLSPLTKEGLYNITVRNNIKDNLSTLLVYNATVINTETALNDAFVIVLAILLVILNFGFGCQMEFKVVWKILKRPIGPVIGACCQFILMPLLGCALTYIFRMENYLGLGLLVTSCAPGGGGSNVWTYILGGDLDLSMTMTFVSKVLALGMMPFWMFALGRLYFQDQSLKIPYTNIVLGIISILIPCVLGMILRKYKPKIALKLPIFIKILSAVIVLWAIIVGSIIQPFIYVIMRKIWYVIVVSFSLPFFGMLFGFVIALILRQGKKRAVTIGIETGLQDTGLAIILLQTSFESPEGDLANTIPISVAVGTPLPLLIALIIKTIYTCWKNGKCASCGGPSPENINQSKENKDINAETFAQENTNNNMECVTDTNMKTKFSQDSKGTRL